jgi:hypothetical protein
MDVPAEPETSASPAAQLGRPLWAFPPCADVESAVVRTSWWRRRRIAVVLYRASTFSLSLPESGPFGCQERADACMGSASPTSGWGSNQIF